MKINVNEIKRFYEDNIKGDMYKDCKISILSNAKKIKMGAVSLTIKVENGEGNESHAVITSLYILSKKDKVCVLFTNNYTNEILFSNMSENAIEISKKYVLNYIERSTKKMLGIEIVDEEKTV